MQETLSPFWLAGSFVAYLAEMPILGNQKNKQHKENKNFAPEAQKHAVFPVGFGEKGSHAPGCLTHSDPLVFLSEARGQVVSVGVELAQRKDRAPSVPSIPCRTVSSGSDSGHRNVQCCPFLLADYSLPKFLSWGLSGCSSVLGGPGPTWCFLGIS